MWLSVLAKKAPAFAPGLIVLAQHFPSLSILLASLLTAALLSALTWLLARLLVLLIGFLLPTTVLATLAALLVLTALILILRHFKLHGCEKTHAINRRCVVNVPIDSRERSYR